MIFPVLFNYHCSWIAWATNHILLYSLFVMNISMEIENNLHSVEHKCIFYRNVITCWLVLLSIYTEVCSCSVSHSCNPTLFYCLTWPLTHLLCFQLKYIVPTQVVWFNITLLCISRLFKIRWRKRQVLPLSAYRTLGKRLQSFSQLANVVNTKQKWILLCKQLINA
jgi:hypothetical protein